MINKEERINQVDIGGGWRVNWEWVEEEEGRKTTQPFFAISPARPKFSPLIIHLAGIIIYQIL